MTSGIPVWQKESLMTAVVRAHWHSVHAWGLCAGRHETTCLPSALQYRLPWHTRSAGTTGSILCFEHQCSCSPRRSGGQTAGHIGCKLLNTTEMFKRKTSAFFSLISICICAELLIPVNNNSVLVPCSKNSRQIWFSVGINVFGQLLNFVKKYL